MVPVDQKRYTAMANLIAIASIVLSIVSTSLAGPYCLPHTVTHPTTGGATYAPSKCWPSAGKWNSLRKKLTGPLNILTATTQSYSICLKGGMNSTYTADAGEGMCMQYHCCAKAFCDVDGRWNIPAYSVEAHNVKDIQAAIQFATKHNIAVTIKTSGHNMAGSSMGYGTLLIWMHRFEKKGDILKNSFKDTCGTRYKDILHIGGGQAWKEAYEAVGEDYHLIAGTCSTVSATGGWLQGGGSSMMSRNYGLGIDNIRSINIVLADGRHVVADKCSNPDLFWALRGGGGGSWGVITSAYYQLQPAEPVVHAYMSITNNGARWMPWIQFPRDVVDSYIDLWVEKSPHLDERWGAHWMRNSNDMYFVGSMAEAETTFINDLKAWKASLTPSQQKAVVFTFKQYTSYYAKKRHDHEVPTGMKSINYANRLVPRQWVLDNPDEAKATLKFLIRAGPISAYLTGGIGYDIDPASTAIHPDARIGLWNVNTMGSDAMINKIRTVWKDFGSGYNGASASEENWYHLFWGTNANRLKVLKKKYDPNNRFNCRYCIGYQEVQLAPPE